MQTGNPHNTQLKYVISSAAVFGILILALLTGCKSKDQQALDQARAQAASTNTPQQVQYIDGKGNLITKTVQPPATQGAVPLVTTTIQPPPAGPVPAETNPVIQTP
jgi:cytochrome oxidase Cu insertion factor (SCO1/SenC/PrrC family)